MIQTGSLFHLTSNFFQIPSKNPLSKNLLNANLRTPLLQVFSGPPAKSVHYLMKNSSEPSRKKVHSKYINLDIYKFLI